MIPFICPHYLQQAVNMFLTAALSNTSLTMHIKKTELFILGFSKMNNLINPHFCGLYSLQAPIVKAWPYIMLRSIIYSYILYKE